MFDYTRLLNLDDDTRDRLISLLDELLYNHYAERGDWVEDLMRYQKDYWAKPISEKATFPYSGAATIVIPLDAIAIEAIHSTDMTTLFGINQFVSAQAIAPDWVPHQRPVELYMDQEIKRMRVRRTFGDCFLEADKYGAMVGKVGYEKQIKHAMRSIGGEEQEFQITIKDGAVFDAVPLARFLMPFSSQDPQTAMMCGEEHSRSPYEVMALETAGMFYPGTAISENENDINKQSKLYRWLAANMGGTQGSGQETGIKFDNTQQEQQNMKPVWPQKIDWVEVWLAFNVDGNKEGKTHDIVVHYHREAKHLMAVRYNWHHDLRRPYRTGVYFPIEHRWTGVGICKMNEQFQKEVTTQHRQRLDNATLANMRMIRISRLSQYGPNEPVFPGKMWFVDNKDDIDTIQMGEIYPSSYNNEQATLIYSQQRTGVNEVTLGMPQVGTPGTATSDLARIQEGKKKFDFVYGNKRDFANEIVLDVASTIQQYGPRRLSYMDTIAGGKMVREFFSMPAEYIRDGLLLELKAAGQQQNKLLDRQNWTQLAPLIQQYYTNLITIAQMTGDQQAMILTMQKAKLASTEAMRQILETYDIRNIDRILMMESENGQSGNPNQPTGNLITGGNSGPSQNGGAPGMADLSQIASLFSR